MVEILERFANTNVVRLCHYEDDTNYVLIHFEVQLMKPVLVSSRYLYLEFIQEMLMIKRVPNGRL